MDNQTTLVLGLCVLGIIGIESFALMKGINGTALAASVGALGGIGGYLVQALRNRRK